jgi:hypothetical protein
VVRTEWAIRFREVIPAQWSSGPHDATASDSTVSGLTGAVHFGPVITNEDHQSPPFLNPAADQPVSSPRTPGGELMDQCSDRHDIPLQATPPTGRGTI